MRRARGVLPYLALGFIVALFAGSALFSFARIEQQSDELVVQKNSLLLLALSLETEYLRLITSFTRYRLDPTESHRADAAHRLDLTWSRLPVLLEGREGAPLRRLDHFDEVIDHTRATLEQADAVLALDSYDRQALDTLNRKLVEVRPLLHDFLIATTLSDELRIDRMHDRLRALQHGLYVSLLGMLASGSLLLFFLVRQIRAVIHARRRAETHSRALQQEMAERERAETALRNSESRFKDFAEVAADWFWETDREVRFSYLSDRFEEIMGLSRSSMLGLRFDQLYEGQAGDLECWRQRAADLAARSEDVEGFEVRWVRPDGEERHLSMSARLVSDAHGEFLGFRGVTRDVTQARQLAEQMVHLASHDPLTGLVNRREFEKRLDRVLRTAKNDDSAHALCFLDLDQFKVVNDTCGHMAGDELIQQIAEVFSSHVRKRDTLSRLGGDEFAVLIEHCSLEQAHRVADQLREAVETFRFNSDGRSFSLSVSIGLVEVDAASESLTAVLGAADSACYAAKDKGRNQVHVHRAGDAQLARRRGEMKWLSRIQRALDTDRFELVAQDIPGLGRAGPSEHFEVLLRLVNDDGERVLPGAFLPSAERYHIAPKIDRWVIRSALGWLAEWRAHMYDPGRCFINLSGLSLGDGQMLDFIVTEMEHTGVEPGRICFEVTETAAISNMANASRFFKELRGRGCRFALDDFGSGLSSFGYLRTLPVDYLKIDGVFVRGIEDDAVDLAMVRSINEIGQLMGKKTIAEFVENEQVLARLRSLGVDYAQGLLFGTPSPLFERRPKRLRDAPAGRVSEAFPQRAVSK